MGIKEIEDCSPKPLFPKIKASQNLTPPPTNVTVLSLNGTCLETTGKILKESSPSCKLVAMNKSQVVRPVQSPPVFKTTSSSVIKPVLHRSVSRGNIFKWFQQKSEQVVEKAECADVNRRVTKMSWGEKPSIVVRGARSVRSFLLNSFIFGIKAVVAAGVCDYCAEEGLWGNPEETRMFYTNILQFVANVGEMPTKGFQGLQDDTTEM